MEPEVVKVLHVKMRQPRRICQTEKKKYRERISKGPLEKWQHLYNSELYLAAETCETFQNGSRYYKNTITESQV